MIFEFIFVSYQSVFCRFLNLDYDIIHIVDSTSKLTLFFLFFKLRFLCKIEEKTKKHLREYSNH